MPGWSFSEGVVDVMASRRFVFFVRLRIGLKLSFRGTCNPNSLVAFTSTICIEGSARYFFDPFCFPNNIVMFTVNVYIFATYGKVSNATARFLGMVPLGRCGAIYSDCHCSKCASILFGEAAALIIGIAVLPAEGPASLMVKGAPATNASSGFRKKSRGASGKSLEPKREFLTRHMTSIIYKFICYMNNTTLRKVAFKEDT